MMGGRISADIAYANVFANFALPEFFESGARNCNGGWFKKRIASSTRWHVVYYRLRAA